MQGFLIKVEPLPQSRNRNDVCVNDVIAYFFYS
jgi:hypothetical protein